MNGREDDYTWSDPYVDNSQVMVVSENSGINSLSDLAGKTVGVQAASAALDLLQSEEEGGQKELADTFAALQQFPDYNNAFVELQAGSIDAVAMDIGVAKYQLESRGEGYKILDEHLNSEKYAIGFKKGNTALCDKRRPAAGSGRRNIRQARRKIRNRRHGVSGEKRRVKQHEVVHDSITA